MACHGNGQKLNWEEMERELKDKGILKERTINVGLRRNDILIWPGVPKMDLDNGLILQLYCCTTKCLPTKPADKLAV